MSIDIITGLRLLHEQSEGAATDVLGAAIAEIADLRQWQAEAVEMLHMLEDGYVTADAEQLGNLLLLAEAT